MIFSFAHRMIVQFVSNCFENLQEHSLFSAKKVTMDDTGEAISKRLRRRTHTNVAAILSAPNMTTKHGKHGGNDPLNSLLRLPDDCLQTIFGFLEVEDLCQMANVCKGFRKIAEQAFAEHHTAFKLKMKMRNNSILRRVFCKFGYLMKSFDGLEKSVQIDMDAMVKYCTALDRLVLSFVPIDCKAVKPLFVRLKELVLDGCEIRGNANSLFSNCKKLEIFGYANSTYTGPYRFIVRKYPKLEELQLVCSHPTKDILFDILKLNPQLKYLQIFTLAEDFYISSVIQHIQNVERLKILHTEYPIFMFDSPGTQTKEVLLKLGNLKKLKELGLDAACKAYSKLVIPLMDAFAKSNIALDQLELRNFAINADDIRSISNMKTIKVLILSKVTCVANADLISLTTTLPLLSKLHLYFGIETKIPLTTNGLVKMVEGGQTLTYVALFRARNMKFDEKVFENLLKAVESRMEQKRVIIDVCGCQWTCSFNVPQSVLQANTNKLVFRYEDDMECPCNKCAE